MKKWNSYKNHISQQTYDSIIIGSGIGGLCTAALLSMQGESVLVLEKHFKIGGWTQLKKEEFGQILKILLRWVVKKLLRKSKIVN